MAALPRLGSRYPPARVKSVDGGLVRIVKLSDGRELFLFTWSEVREAPHGSYPASVGSAFVEVPTAESVCEADARRLLSLLEGRGCGLVAFFGGGGESFHDLVDELLPETLEEEHSPTIPTTWHDDDELDEALDMFWMGLGDMKGRPLLAIVAPEGSRARDALLNM